MKKTTFTNLKSQGFTMTEILVTVVILAVLMLLLVGVARKSFQTAARADSVRTMQNIGTAIAQYVTDNNQTLPGPMPGQQHPALLKGGRWLPNYIAPYLAPDQEAISSSEFSQSGTLLKGFVPKHWEQWYKKAKPTTPRVYEMPFTQYVVNGVTIVPFGKVDPLTSPSNYLMLIQNLEASKRVAFRSYHGTSKESQLAPPLGEIQDFTMKLYFDWHVEVE